MQKRFRKSKDGLRNTVAWMIHTVARFFLHLCEMLRTQSRECFGDEKISLNSKMTYCMHSPSPRQDLRVEHSPSLWYALSLSTEDPHTLRRRWLCCVLWRKVGVCGVAAACAAQCEMRLLACDLRRCLEDDVCVPAKEKVLVSTRCEGDTERVEVPTNGVRDRGVTDGEVWVLGVGAGGRCISCLRSSSAESSPYKSRSRSLSRSKSCSLDMRCEEDSEGDFCENGESCVARLR